MIKPSKLLISRKSLFVFLLTFMVAAITLSASASVKDSLSKRFEDATIRGGVGTYESLGRTVMQGGYVRTRFEVKSAPNLVKLQGPSISGGCNGFDIYGGSFSYISGDEIIEWLKSVTENAGALATYMFLTFLQEACSVCGEVMNTLYALQDLINSTMGGSCETASAIVNGVKGIATGSESEEWNSYKARITDGANRVVQAGGKTKDALDSMNQTTTNLFKTVSESTDPKDTEAFKEVQGGNMLYWIIADEDDHVLTQMKITAGDIDKNRLYTYLSAYVGNVIKSVDANNTPKEERIKPIITLESIIQNDYADKVISGADCGGAFDDKGDFCIEPKEVKMCYYVTGNKGSCDNSVITPFQEKLMCLLVGVPAEGGSADRCKEIGVEQSIQGTLGSTNPSTEDIKEGTILSSFLSSTWPNSSSPIYQSIKKSAQSHNLLGLALICKKDYWEISFARSQVMHALKTVLDAFDGAALKNVSPILKAEYKALIEERIKAIDQEAALLWQERGQSPYSACSTAQMDSYFKSLIEGGGN